MYAGLYLLIKSQANFIQLIILICCSLNSNQASITAAHMTGKLACFASKSRFLVDNIYTRKHVAGNVITCVVALVEAFSIFYLSI